MDKHSKEEKRRDLMRKLDFGEGISVTIEDGEKVDYFFTNRVEGVKARSKQAIGNLEVELSSAQVDDERLLEKLHTSMTK